MEEQMGFVGFTRHLPVLALILAGASMSQAATLYSAPPNQSGGSDLNTYLEAENVSTGSNVTITSIKFWSFQTSVADYTGSIDWSINLDAAGVPGGVVSSGSATPSGVSTGNSGFGFSEFSYTFPVNVPVAAGTFWVVLHNGPASSIPSGDFYWGWSNANAGDSQQQDISVSGQPWLSNFAELALEIQTADERVVPEPSSLMLAGAGLLSVFLARSRKSRYGKDKN
jgi:hypothetical protein